MRIQSRVFRSPILIAGVMLVSVVSLSALAQQSTAPATQPALTLNQPSKTPSGLTITKVAEGEAKAEVGDYLYIHFTGSLSDGKKIASSIERGEPVEFTLGVGDVLKAWDEGLMGMKVGEKRKVVAPPEMGYGAKGQGQLIPPNAELTFEFELVGLRKAPPKPAAPATTPTTEPTQPE